VIRVTDGGRTLAAHGLPAGATAYIDADWVKRVDAEVPALVVDGDGIRWNDGAAVPVPGGESDSAAAALFREVAAEAVSRVPEDARSVKVLGDGLVATEARLLLDTRAGSAPGQGERPGCVIDATGDPDAILNALGELDDLGTLVAAGPLGDRPFPINLYAHVHLRGLHVVGVAPPLADGRLPERLGAPAAPPASAAPGEPLGTGKWFRVAAEPRSEIVS
jgi:hypothetical protein